MDQKTDKLIDTIVESYKKYDTTSKIGEENMLNKEIIIEVLESIRKILE